MSEKDYGSVDPEGGGPVLRARVRCDVPHLTADIEVAPGTTLGILGPNGAGKSTLLSVLAGLRRTPGSTVSFGDRILQGDGVFVAPHRRNVVLLEQKARLFPHLSVRRNVEFGPAARGLPKPTVRERAARWMTAVGVADLADRMPAGLSGGQAQRVAIARALATEPDVLLLDEPFAALDVDVAQQMRSLMRGLIAERAGATLLVTHDLVDAVGLADQLAVIDHGRIVQSGPTTTVLAHPETHFAATLSGVNLVTGRYAEPATVVGADGLRVVGTGIGDVDVGSPAAAAFSSRAVALYPHEPHGSPRNTWRAEIDEVAPRGDRAVVRARRGGHVIAAEVTWESVAELGLGPGAPVYLTVKATEVRVYGAAGASPATGPGSEPPPGE